MRKKLIIAMTVIVVAAIAVWTIPSLRNASDGMHEGHESSATLDSAADAGGEILYYTCTMHPSVKSPTPGRCPICNMDLAPVMKSAPADTGAVDLTFHVSGAKQQLIGVTFAPAEHRDVHKIIRAYGRVEYDETRLAVVNLRVGGWVDRLYADFEGKFVRAGQPLFRLYSPDLLSAQSEYLLARQAADTTKQAYASALLTTARERLRLWLMTDEQIGELEQRGRPETHVAIVSPASGYVVEKMVVQGMRVEPEMALYKIADLSRVWVHADVYEYELPFVRVGQEATILLPGTHYTGRISYIYPYLHTETRTTRVRIELPNREGALKPDMYAEVNVHVDLGERLVVPESAVLRTGERQIVFVNRGQGIFELRLVKLGVRAEGFYEITDGLSEGEQVVSSANFLIDAESNVQGVLRRMEGAAVVEAAPPVHRH
jgi:RND family efflux transporter MFP subunit